MKLEVEQPCDAENNTITGKEVWTWDPNSQRIMNPKSPRDIYQGDFSKKEKEEKEDNENRKETNVF